MKRVATKLKDDLNLVPCGTGAQMMDEVAMLALSFNYYKSVGVEEGRELLISTIHTFLSEINQNEEIRPYLRNFPFEPKNLEIRIYLKNADGTDFLPDKLSVINAIGGGFQYKIFNRKELWLRTVYKETYERALERPTDITWDPEPLPERSGDTENKNMEVIFVS